MGFGGTFHVEWHNGRLSAASGDYFVVNGFEFFHSTAQQNNGRAAGGKGFRCFTPNTVTGARYQNGFSRQAVGLNEIIFRVIMHNGHFMITLYVTSGMMIGLSVLVFANILSSNR